MTNKFRNIPNPPRNKSMEDLNWYEQIKYNLEILMGQRQGDGAVLRSDIDLLKMPDLKLTRLKTGQQGVVISGSAVPTLEDYEQLQKDVDILRADLSVAYTYLNSLILKLRVRDK